jgi:hypothetical protein
MPQANAAPGWLCLTRPDAAIDQLCRVSRYATKEQSGHPREAVGARLVSDTTSRAGVAGVDLDGTAAVGLLLDASVRSCSSSQLVASTVAPLPAEQKNADHAGGSAIRHVCPVDPPRARCMWESASNGPTLCRRRRGAARFPGVSRTRGEVACTRTQFSFLVGGRPGQHRTLSEEPVQKLMRQLALIVQ